jgi:multidrug efflux pump subunit AcrA (membrane-fusion protein)
MRNQAVLDLAECTTFRQTLLARPPRIAHGTIALLVVLLGAAAAWAALTRADLVVRAPGRVRPLATPKKVFSAARADVLSASTGGRVIEVDFREGDQVKVGDLLIRLESGHLDNEIARQRRTIQSAEEELASLHVLETLTASQFQANRARAAAELSQTQEEVERATKFQVADIRQAEVELATARDDESILGRLASSRAIAPAEHDKAVAHLRDAVEKLAKARLPVSAGKVQVARRSLEQVDQDGDVKSKELALKRQAKQGEIAAARIELANAELERRQAEIRAPIAGVVVRGDVKVGDVLEPGKPAVEIAEQTGFLFEVQVPSEEVGDLRLGMAVRVKLDAYDYQRYGTMGGTVSFISPDSGVTEGQPRATYLVRVALDGDEVGRGDLRGQVKLGISGQADIVTDRECLLKIFAKKIRRTISLG